MKYAQDAIDRRGLMFVLSSPSGAGKTTIARRLIKADANLHMSVSHTTRKRRPGEVDGVDYQFSDEASFNDSVSNGEFLEWAKVFAHYYGTPKQPVERSLSIGKDILFDIDWQGTQQLAQTARGDLVTIFLLPPSWTELERRLVERAQDTHETVQFRMDKATDEISHWAEYDYVIVNDDLDRTTKQVHNILNSERLKRSRQTGMTKFVKDLCGRI